MIEVLCEDAEGDRLNQIAAGFLKRTRHGLRDAIAIHGAAAQFVFAGLEGGNNVAQWARVFRDGHSMKLPASSNWLGMGGSLPSGNISQRSGGGRMSAFFHGALEKLRSPAGTGFFCSAQPALHLGQSGHAGLGDTGQRYRFSRSHNLRLGDEAREALHLAIHVVVLLGVGVVRAVLVR